MVLAPSLLTAVVIQLGCQVFKIVRTSLRERRFAWRVLFSAGGMPSAHSAFVIALATAVGMRAGFDSDTFSVAAVLAAVVVYDTSRVRGLLQRHSRIIDRLVAASSISLDRPLPAVGHTPLELAIGALVGIGGGVALSLILR